jgi:hypothetical protein
MVLLGTIIFSAPVRADDKPAVPSKHAEAKEQLILDVKPVCKDKVCTPPAKAQQAAPVAASDADPIKVARAALDADQTALTNAIAQIKASKALVADGVTKKAAALSAVTKDRAALLVLIDQLYPIPSPDVPPPDDPPPSPPDDPPPSPPTPPAPPKPNFTLTLISSLPTDPWQCGTCVDVRNNTLPKLSLGDQLKLISYSDPQSMTLYGETNVVPRWVLVRDGGVTEKVEGGLTADQVMAWIGGKKP